MGRCAARGEAGADDDEGPAAIACGVTIPARHQKHAIGGPPDPRTGRASFSMSTPGASARTATAHGPAGVASTRREGAEPVPRPMWRLGYFPTCAESLAS